MNMLLLCVTVDFPFKKSWLSEPDASLSNNRGKQSCRLLITGSGNGQGWALVIQSTEMTDSCPYRMSKEHNLRQININIFFSEFKFVGLGCIKNWYKCCSPSIIPLQNTYCNKTHTCYWPCCRILICFYSDWPRFYEELSHHQTPFKFSGNWHPEIILNIVLYCNFFLDFHFQVIFEALVLLWL